MLLSYELLASTGVALSDYYNMIIYKLIAIFLCFILVLQFEQVYVDNLPSSESYEKSYMHRDFVTHIVVTK